MAALFVVMVFASALCAGVPMLGFLMIVWWMDRHDREPLWLFGLTFAWGAIGSILLALAGSSAAMVPLEALVGASMADSLSAVLIAPLVEEPTKALILFAILFSRHFDNATDGFVYGAAAGLGFGMTENFFYFIMVGGSGDIAGWAQTVVIRTFYSAVMHACATSIVGAALGWARFRGIGPRLLALPLGFGAAMGIHALWNGLLTDWGAVVEPLHARTAEEVRAGMELLSSANFILFPVEAMLIFGLFQLALWEERATIRRELADEVKQGLLPLAHASAIASYWKRRGTQWLPPNVPHWPYVRAVTRLALRKHQCRNSSSRTYDFYADEVARLRREVQGLLALSEKKVARR